MIFKKEYVQVIIILIYFVFECFCFIKNFQIKSIFL